MPRAFVDDQTGVRVQRFEFLPCLSGVSASWRPRTGAFAGLTRAA